MNKSVNHWVQKLNLEAHPEGGYFKEVYRSKLSASKIEGFKGERNFSTAIYFLIDSSNFSSFHRIKSDEIWHFYYGDPLVVHMIDEEGKYSSQKVGLKIDNNEVPQFVVKAGCWFASEVEQGGAYSLVGCTVSPGFDFDDFELAQKSNLIYQYPEHQIIIDRLTRD